MSQRHPTTLGVMFRRQNPPETLPAYARRAEQLGLEELWVVEDCFFASGIASAAVALAVTADIHIGLGIMPAVARNAAFTAMEIATLARTYPRRFTAGIGHGVAVWMRQIGAFPSSQLAALDETASVTQRLLAGETVTFHGQHVHIDNVKLEFPPATVPPVILGVSGPKSLHLSGQIASGTIIPECSSPAYVAWARQQIAHGQAAAGRAGEPHRLTVYVFCAVDEEGAAARQRVRAPLAQMLSNGNADQLRPLGIQAEVTRLVAAGGWEHLSETMPDAWIDLLTVAGTPAECAAAIHRLYAAGADSVVLVTEPGGVESLDGVAAILAVLAG